MLRGLGYAALEIFPHVEKAEALDPHQPFEGRTGGKIDSHCPHVDGHRAGPLDNIDIDIRAVGVGQIAERRDVGQIAVDIGDEGGRDQAGIAIDDSCHIIDIDLPVAIFNDAHLQTVALPHPVIVERGIVVQIVGYDIAAGQVLRQTVEQVALGFDGAASEGDLLRPGIDQLREQALRFVAGLRPSRPPRITNLAGGPVDIAMQRRSHINAERMTRGIVEIGGGSSAGKVGAHCVEVRWRRKR